MKFPHKTLFFSNRIMKCSYKYKIICYRLKNYNKKIANYNCKISNIKI